MVAAPDAARPPPLPPAALEPLRMRTMEPSRLPLRLRMRLSARACACVAAAPAAAARGGEAAAGGGSFAAAASAEAAEGDAGEASPLPPPPVAVPAVSASRSPAQTATFRQHFFSINFQLTRQQGHNRRHQTRQQHTKGASIYEAHRARRRPARWRGATAARAR